MPASSPTTRSRRAVFLRPVLLITVGATVAVVAAEVLLRVTGLAPAQGTLFTVSDRQFERIPGIFEPVESRVVRGIGDLSYQASINSLGYRGPDFASTPSDGELRVLFTGDSFVFGDHVDDPETLPSQTELLLSERCAHAVRIVNAGLGDSTLRDQIELVRRARQIRPSIVFQLFSEDDIRDLMGPSTWEQLAENRAAKSAFPLSVFYPIARHMALWNLALRVRSVARSQEVDRELAADGGEGPDAGPAALEPSGTPAVDQSRERYADLLRELRDGLGEDGVGLVFIVYPSHHTVYGTVDSDQYAWAVALGQELGLPTVSLLEPLEADGRPSDDLYLMPLNGNPSPAGYRVAAEHLVERLLLHTPFLEACA